MMRGSCSAILAVAVYVCVCKRVCGMYVLYIMYMLRMYVMLCVQKGLPDNYLRVYIIIYNTECMIILYMLVRMYLGILGIYTNFLCCWSCALCKCSTADHRKWQSHYHSYWRSAHYVTESTGRRLLFVLGKECRGTGWRPSSARCGRIQGKHFWYVRLSVTVIRMSARHVCIYVYNIHLSHTCISMIFCIIYIVIV